MVKTRSDLKIKIKEFVEEQEEPFKTSDVVQYSRMVATNIHVSPQRLQNYIRSVSGVVFNKSKRQWEQPIDPTMKQFRGATNAKKRQRSI